MFLATVVLLVGAAMVLFYFTEAVSRAAGRELHPLDLIDIFTTSASIGLGAMWRALKRSKPAGWRGGC